jgi:hypothetical protein
MAVKQGKTNWKFILLVIILATIIGGGSFFLCKILDCGTVDLVPTEEKSDTECQKYTADECPEGCIVCPPCEACSSLGCYSAEHCKSIGFDESWYEMIKLQR